MHQHNSKIKAETLKKIVTVRAKLKKKKLCIVVGSCWKKNIRIKNMQL